MLKFVEKLLNLFFDGIFKFVQSGSFLSGKNEPFHFTK
jgi:hypothetical protein